MNRIVKIETPEHRKYALLLYSQARQSTLLKNSDVVKLRQANRALRALEAAWIDEVEEGQNLFIRIKGQPAEKDKKPLDLPELSIPQDEHSLVVQLVEHVLKGLEQPMLAAKDFFAAIDWWDSAEKQEAAPAA